ncbi:MAG: hypothetical protein IT249_06800 [Chitinophagaceae bacterium]|nr:hypothetical protein [Chitinophagaceae bacterium]
MPENDFEKQVQDLFDGLNLKPSDKVWHNVDERIHKDKRRRRVIFWIPLLLLLLGGTGAYMMWGHAVADKNVSKNIATLKETKNTSTENLNNRAHTEQNTIAGTNKNTAENKKITPAEISNAKKNGLGYRSSPVSYAKTGKQVTPQVTDKYTRKNTLFPTFNVSKKMVKANKQEAGENFYDIKTPHAQYKNFPADTITGNIEGEFIGETVQQYIQIHPFILSWPGNEKYIDTLSHNTHAGTVSNSNVRLAKKQLWEFGINASAGFSKTGSGLSDIFNKLSFEKSLSADYATTPVNNLNAGFVASQNNIYLAALPTSATPVKRGLMWNAGVSVKWYLKPKLALTGNFQYSYFSTSREVGSFLNNNGAFTSGLNNSARYSGYYYGNNSVDYKNKYHLLEMPLGIQWQLNKGTKLFPLQLNSGLSAGWLLHSNALHYDKPTGTYYRDESLFNKFQLGLYAGLSAKLFQHSRMPLYIGPYMQYGLSNLVRSSSGTQQNLMSVGIKTEWILWKK